MTRSIIAVMPLMLIVAACSGSGDAPAALTADQDRQLNEAAEMLDANSVVLEPANITTGNQP